MKTTKKCPRCGGKFGDREGFETCPSCRIPLPTVNRLGGCSRWGSADFDKNSKILDIPPPPFKKAK